MQVRTRREGVDSKFALSAPLSNITSAVATLQEGCCANPCTSQCISIQYNIRIGSRTAFLFQYITSLRHVSVLSCLRVNQGISSTKTGFSGCDGDPGSPSPADVDVCGQMMSASDEVDRYDTFLKLSSTLTECFCWSGSSAGKSNRAKAGLQDWSLLTPQESRELPARWVMQSLNDMKGVRAHRDAVTLLDCGASVRLRHEGAALYRVIDVAEMVGNCHWVDIETTVTPPVHRRRIDREELILDPPHPVHFDPLIPADELSSARGTSTCLFLTATLALRKQRLPGGDIGTMRSLPTNIAVRVAQCAREARKELHMRSLSRRAPPNGLHTPVIQVSTKLEVEMMCDCVTLRYAGKTVEVLQRVMERLSVLWDVRMRRDGDESGTEAYGLWRRLVAIQVAAANGQHAFTTREPFFVSTFTMLLRYRALLGELGYNQGPHAAVPPVVLKRLYDAFDVQCEAFASPLNTQLPQFGSIFPDTDCCFGSIGSFFDLSLVSGHYEVNPPFVTAVLQRLKTFLLDETLACHDDEDAPSLLFVVVLPSHDLDETEKDSGSASDLKCTTSDCGAKNKKNGVRMAKKRRRVENDGISSNNEITNSNRDGLSTDQVLRESAFCLSHTLCPAAESVYVDGHQHLLRAPLFCIGTPTRLIVLGNRAARRRYNDAPARLSAVRETWRRYTIECQAGAGDDTK